MLKIALVFLCYFFNVVAFSAPIDVSKPQDAIPPNVVTTANRPMVMLAASKEPLC